MSFEKLKKLIAKRKKFEKKNRFYPYNNHTLVFTPSNISQPNPDEIFILLKSDGSLFFQVRDPKDPKKTVINNSIEKSELCTKLGTRYDEFLCAINENKLSEFNEFSEIILESASKKYFNPYREYRTDLNFHDIHGKSLLHYAAEEGMLDEVKRLIAEGSDINLKTVDWPEDQKTATMFALENGHLEISEYLYQQGANCSEVFLEKMIHPQCREWLINKIKEEINRCCEISEKSGVSCLNINIKASSQSQFFTYDGLDDPDEILFRIVEIGATDHLISYKNSYPSIYSMHPEFRGAKALLLAAANGHLEIVKFLFDRADVPINPIRPYTTSALQAAISANQLDMAKYLFSRGADITWQDHNKYNSLMIAVKYRNKGAVEWLLKQKADTDQTDVHGNSLLYLAVEAGDEMILKLLLNHEEIKSQLANENIYGHSALDIAVFKNRSSIIALLPPKKEKTFQVGALLDIEIDHHAWIKKMFYYLHLRYLSTEFFPLIGKCNGASYLHNHYQARADYLFGTLELLKKWDGEEEDLYIPLPETMPQTKYFKNLDELFYQKINDVLWFQHSTFNNIAGQPDTFPKYDQMDREKQYALIGNEKNDELQLLFSRGDWLDLQQIQEILNYFKRMPTGTQLEITGARHATSAYINENQEIVYYDPRFPYRTKPFKDAQSLLKTIIDFKFINIGFYPANRRKFDIKIYFFIASKNLHRFNEDFHIFSQKEYDQSVVETFQNKSSNEFTPLHVAVLSRSLSSLNKLLEGEYCDVNADDYFSKTALDLAIEFNFKEAIEMLLMHPTVDITWKNVTKILDKKYSTHTEIFDCNPLSSLINCLTHSILNKNKPLINALIRVIKKQKLNLDQNDFHNRTPLSYAVQSKNDEIVKVLLSNGARWGTVCKDEFGFRTLFSAMELVIRQYEHHYSLMIQTLTDINENDGNSNAAIHYTAKYGKISLMKDLMDRGANFQLRNKDNYTPLGLVIDGLAKGVFDEKTFVELVTVITGHINFIMSTENVEYFYKIMTYCTDKKFRVPFDINMQTKVSRNTLLHHALIDYNAGYSKEDVELLLKNGAKWDIQNKEGKTAYDLVSNSGYEELLSIFNAYKASIAFNPLFTDNSATHPDQNASFSVLQEETQPSVFSLDK